MKFWVVTVDICEGCPSFGSDGFGSEDGVKKVVGDSVIDPLKYQSIKAGLKFRINRWFLLVFFR